MRIHSGNLFTCPLCPFSATVNCVLRRHIEIHLPVVQEVLVEAGLEKCLGTYPDLIASSLKDLVAFPTSSKDNTGLQRNNVSNIRTENKVNRNEEKATTRQLMRKNSSNTTNVPSNAEELSDKQIDVKNDEKWSDNLSLDQSNPSIPILKAMLNGDIVASDSTVSKNTKNCTLRSTSLKRGKVKPNYAPKSKILDSLLDEEEGIVPDSAESLKNINKAARKKIKTNALIGLVESIIQRLTELDSEKFVVDSALASCLQVVLSDGHEVGENYLRPKSGDVMAMDVNNVECVEEGENTEIDGNFSSTDELVDFKDNKDVVGPRTDCIDVEEGNSLIDQIVFDEDIDPLADCTND